MVMISPATVVVDASSLRSEPATLRLGSKEAEPIWPLRITRYALIGIILVGIIATVLSLKPEGEPLTLVEFIQTLEAGINDVVLISVGVFFVWTLEARLKRRRALASVRAGACGECGRA